jgi:hypothetical protein
VEAQATNKDAEEEDVFEIRVQMSTKTQPTIMEINMSAPGATKAKKCATIMDKTTLLDKSTHIPNHNQFVVIDQTKL